MQLYKHHQDKKVEWNRYLISIMPYFNVCKDKTILEIGPMFGTHTNLIKHYAPKNITFVELDHNAVTSVLPTDHPDCELIVDDIFLFLEKPHNFDVVVCCGVLYHLHSPLYLLELIANRINPEYILLETFSPDKEKLNEPHAIIKQEHDNELGARQIVPNWKSCGVAIIMSNQIFINAMNNLGYDLIKTANHVIKPSNPNENIFFGVFKQR
jgi:2-polyprenyl-3-methyl-5-hydroxy-6-metoxy-1,4-benzoquinol methylase